jgi:acetyltransferase-like isoleucine patch superfamily enzyme
MVFLLIRKVSKLFCFISGTITIGLLKFNSNISIGKGIRVVGMPCINMSEESKLIIENNVTLNSFNPDYHANMFAKVKFFIEGDASIVIGEQTRIHGSCLHARKSIVIGKRCLIAANCQIIDSNGHRVMMRTPQERFKSVDEPKPILIEDDVWIGLNSIILPGVKIGRGSVISANSVVKHDVQPLTIVGGNPAVILKMQE